MREGHKSWRKMKEKLEQHNFITKQKVEVQREHLEFFRKQAEENQMTGDLAIRQTCEKI